MTGEFPKAKAPSLPAPEAVAENDALRRRRHLTHSFEAKALKGRTFSQRMADSIIKESGTLTFALAHAIFFGEWIIINLGLVPWLPIFDPFPFGLLTMIVSLEAIFLAIFVLISQNRQSYVATLRDELHMQINMIAEQEITKTLALVAEIHKHLRIAQRSDVELEKMLKRIDTSSIENALEREIEKSDKGSLLAVLGSKSREGLKKIAEITRNGKVLGNSKLV